MWQKRLAQKSVKINRTIKIFPYVKVRNYLIFFSNLPMQLNIKMYDIIFKKTMYLVEDIDDKEKLKDIVIDTCKGLKI